MQQIYKIKAYPLPKPITLPDDKPSHPGKAFYAKQKRKSGKPKRRKNK